MIRWLAFLLALIAAPATAQVGTIDTTLQPGWNPAADYITVGQDEIGYRSWYMASLRHQQQVRAFNDYLETWQVSGVLPTWQILRTATSWHRCGGMPFEVPPTSEWPHIVQTLRYVRDYVVPAVGPVEAVSAYRNPSLNACAGGAPESAHKHYSAIDMVPLRRTSRGELMRTLCAVQARRGPNGNCCRHAACPRARLKRPAGVGTFGRWYPTVTLLVGPCVADQQHQYRRQDQGVSNGS